MISLRAMENTHFLTDLYIKDIFTKGTFTVKEKFNLQMVIES